jgi:hypothetical protein
MKAEKTRADASGETAAREKEKEEKALQKQRKIANGGRNVKRRKVE